MQSAKNEVSAITDKHLQEINRRTRLIVGEPTQEKMDVIVRSVMLSTRN